MLEIFNEQILKFCFFFYLFFKILKKKEILHFVPVSGQCLGAEGNLQDNPSPKDSPGNMTASN